MPTVNRSLSAVEGQAPFTVLVGEDNQRLTYTYRVLSGGTATYGEDFEFRSKQGSNPEVTQGASGVVVDPSTGYQFSIKYFTDAAKEGNEFFDLEVVENDDGEVTTFVYRVTIADKPLIAQILAGDPIAGSSGEQSVTFTVELAVPFEKGTLNLDVAPLVTTAAPLTLQYDTDWKLKGGAGDGYTLRVDPSLDPMLDVGRIVFKAGETSKQVKVTYHGDALPDATSETLGLQLRNPDVQKQDVTIAKANAVQTLTFASQGPTAIVTLPAGTAMTPAIEAFLRDINAALQRISDQVPGGLPNGITIDLAQKQLGENFLAEGRSNLVLKLYSPDGQLANLRPVYMPETLYRYLTQRDADPTTADIRLGVDFDALSNFYSGQQDKANLAAWAATPAGKGVDVSGFGTSYDAKQLLVHELLHGLGFGRYSGGGILNDWATSWTVITKAIPEQTVLDGATTLKSSRQITLLGKDYVLFGASGTPGDHFYQTNGQAALMTPGVSVINDLQALDVAALALLGYARGPNDAPKGAVFDLSLKQLEAVEIFGNVLRDVSGKALDYLLNLVGAESKASIIEKTIGFAQDTVSVALMAYQFFTGKIPSEAGIEYLVSPDGPNPNNLNSAYYEKFNLENRYINFSVNLGKLGEGAAKFAADYGALSLADATKKAYATIFGVTPTDAKVGLLLGGGRDAYFDSYGKDGLNGLGTKAAMVGWLLAEAEKANIGTYALSNAAFLTDLADGATFAVDMIGVYGKPEFGLA